MDRKIESYSTSHAEGSILKIKWVGGVMEKKSGQWGINGAEKWAVGKYGTEEWRVCNLKYKRIAILPSNCAM